MTRRIAWVLFIALSLASAPPGPASAQQVLEFKRVSDDSVSSLERRGARRAAARRPAARLPDADVPESPETPETPESPSTPRSVGKTGNIMRIGQDVHVEKDQVVSGDLLALGGDVTVEGHVQGDVVAMGGDVHLGPTARVDGDVACLGGELTEEEGSSIGGQRVTAARGFRGSHNLDRMRLREQIGGFRAAARLAGSLVWLFIVTVIAWGFASLAPGRTRVAHETMKREPALSLGIGGLVWALFIPSVVALLLVVAILCITIIGIPLALAALFGYFVFLGLLAAWGYAVSAVAIGEITARRFRLGASPMTAPGNPPVSISPAPGNPPVTISLQRKAVLGALVLGGAGLVGEFLHALFFAPPLQGLGVFIAVVAKIATIIASTFGAGALLRSEAVAGTFRRWWGGPKRVSATGSTEVPGTTFVPASSVPVAEPASPPPQI